MLDERAALQRQREAEAEAKLQAKKAAMSSGTRIPDRSAPIRQPAPDRTDPSERPTPTGPPRLNLAGNKPSWREREEAKKVQQPSAIIPPAAPNSDMATEEAQLPKKTQGYVPPARRSAADVAPLSRGRPENTSTNRKRSGSRGGSNVKWRPGIRQDDVAHEHLPADGASPRPLGGLRGLPSGRDASVDSARPLSSDGIPRTQSPAESIPKPAPGKFVPPHLRNKQ